MSKCLYIMANFLAATYYGNSISTWALAVLVTSLTLVALHVVRTVALRRLSAIAASTKSSVDDIAAGVLGKTHILFLIILAVYIGSSILFLPPALQNVITKASVVGLFLQGAIWGSGVIEFTVEHYVHHESKDGGNSVIASRALSFVGRIVIWVCVILAVLSNLGVNVTALVAGLGVGSVAVALALQNILADLFSAVSIVLDKPFTIGDFIIVDTYLGVVEHIGVKSTRIRSLEGDLMVFSNSDLLKSRIRNYKHMYQRRVVFSIGVTYDTPYEKLTNIPNIIRHIIEEQDETRFDRAHFKDYGNFSLNYEIVYCVLGADYNAFMDIQQAINLAIFRQFGAEGITFAFPTQTILLDKTN